MLRTITTVLALCFIITTALSQDCDSDGLPDAAEFGPFYPNAGGGLRFVNDATRALVNSTDFSLANQSFTIEFWIYRDTATGLEEYILFNGNQAINEGLTIGFRANQRFTFAFWGSDLDTPAFYPPDGQWHHWMCRYEASTNFRWIYRDGVEVAFGTAPTDYQGPSGPLYLGGLPSGASFNGIIDELRIFDHARSNAELLADLNTQYVDQYKVDATLPAGLHAYYPFEPGYERCDLAGENDIQGNNLLDMISFADDENANNIPDLCEPPIDLTNALYVPHEFPTIQSAIDAAQDGDTVIVAPGLYNEAIGIPSSKAITLRGAAGAKDTVITPPTGARGIFVTGPAIGTTTIEQLTIQGAYIENHGPPECGSAIYINGGRVLVQDCRFRSNYIEGIGTIYGLNGLENIQILRCSFEYNTADRGAGVFVFTDENDPPMLIRDCLFTRNNSIDSVILYIDLTGAAMIDGCTFINNTIPSFSSVVRGHGSGSERDVVVQNSIFHSNGAPVGDGSINQFNNFVSDPMLVDPVGGDFRPMPGSPVIDAAFTSWNHAAATDLSGYPRALDDPNTPDAHGGNSNGFVADIGAFEYAPDFNIDCIDDITDYAGAPDCNQNYFPDPMDILLGLSTDIDSNGVPDDCQPDCNGNGIPDSYELATQTEDDLDGNGIPDSCQRITNITQSTFHSTIQLAINLADADDVIELEDGVYTGAGNSNLASTNRDLTIRSASLNPQSCILDAEGQGPFFVWYGGSAQLGHTLYQGLTFQNGQSSSVRHRDATFVDCSFFDFETNWAAGGVLALHENSTTRIWNSVFVGNTLTNGRGGAIACNWGSTVEINNTLFIDNFAPWDGSAITAADGSTILLKNCIVWNNDFSLSGSPIFTVEHSLVDGGWAGVGIINADPIFIDPDGPDNDPMTLEDNNYRLSSFSPAIDSGTNSGVTATDLDNLPRIVNTTVDMGPYEYQGPPPCPADLNSDAALDFFDVSAFLAAFAAQDPIADFNPDATFDFFDVSAFLSAFAAGCP